MRYHQPTVDYVARRTADGRTKREIIRCLKRFLAREIYQRVMTDFRARQELIRCFRHQVLLRSDGPVRDRSNGPPAWLSEHSHDAQPPDDAPHLLEDVPKRQPPHGKPRLHCRRPRPRVRTSAPLAVERSCSSNVVSPGAHRACPARANGTAIRRDKEADPCRMVRFRRLMNDVFTVDESSEGVSAWAKRKAAPITNPSVDPHDAVMATRLDHLTRRAQQDLRFDGSPSRRTRSHRSRSRDRLSSVIHDAFCRELECQGVPVAAAFDDGRRPET